MMKLKILIYFLLTTILFSQVKVEDVVGTFENIIGAASALHDFGAMEVTNLQFEHDPSNYLYYWMKATISESDPNPYPSWVNITNGNLLSGWTLAETSAYLKDEDGIIRFKGALAAGTLNNKIFILPEGYRPAATRKFSIATQDVSLNPTSPSYLSIEADGDVYIFAPVGTTRAYLDNINFKVD